MLCLFSSRSALRAEFYYWRQWCHLSAGRLVFYLWEWCKCQQKEWSRLCAHTPKIGNKISRRHVEKMTFRCAMSMPRILLQFRSEFIDFAAGCIGAACVKAVCRNSSYLKILSCPALSPRKACNVYHSTGLISWEKRRHMLLSADSSLDKTCLKIWCDEFERAQLSIRIFIINLA